MNRASVRRIRSAPIAAWAARLRCTSRMARFSRRRRRSRTRSPRGISASRVALAGASCKIVTAPPAMAIGAMAVAEHPLAGLGYASVSSDQPLVRITGERAVRGSACVAEEIPIALVYNGRPYVVVMGTPADLGDLAIGFSLTEAIVERTAAIERVEVVRARHAIELPIQFPATAAA